MIESVAAVAFGALTTDDRAQYYLALWSRWQQRDDTHLGFPDHVPVFLSGGAWDTDSELAKLDDAAALAADAVIAGLDVAHRLVIRNAYECAIVQFTRAPVIGVSIRDAHQTFMIGMRKRGFV